MCGIKSSSRILGLLVVSIIFLGVNFAGGGVFAATKSNSLSTRTNQRINLKSQSAIVSTSSTVVVPAYRNAFPIDRSVTASFGESHHSYPATDIFAKCGAGVLAPVSGTVNDVNRIDSWNQEKDDPWLRGGKFVSIVGVDGVRYYFAHFANIRDDIKIGTRVQAGRSLGTVGRTGRAGACHLHFGLSPTCPNREWWVRRGVIWPATYLKAWLNGFTKSPEDEVQRWSNQNPKACLNKQNMPWPSN